MSSKVYKYYVLYEYDKLSEEELVVARSTSESAINRCFSLYSSDEEESDFTYRIAKITEEPYEVK